jgi:hypothetical protein
MNLTEVTDLTSIGTLFAFILVSGGVLVLNPRGIDRANRKGFAVPYINSRYYLPLVWLMIGVIVWLTAENTLANQAAGGWHHQFPFFIFIVASAITTGMAVFKQWSLIPVLGLLTNLYLMSELGITNWMRFLVWLVIGLVLYFLYGAKHSRLRNNNNPQLSTTGSPD